MTREGFVNALEGIKDFETGGLCGPITFGPDDRKGNDFYRVFKADVARGIFLPVTDWRRPSIE